MKNWSFKICSFSFQNISKHLNYKCRLNRHGQVITNNAFMKLHNGDTVCQSFTCPTRFNLVSVRWRVFWLYLQRFNATPANMKLSGVYIECNGFIVRLTKTFRSRVLFSSTMNGGNIICRKHPGITLARNQSKYHSHPASEIVSHLKFHIYPLNTSLYVCVGYELCMPNLIIIRLCLSFFGDSAFWFSSVILYIILINQQAEDA